MYNAIEYDYFEYNGIKYPIGTVVRLAAKYDYQMHNRRNKDTIIRKHYSSCNRHFYWVFDGYNACGDLVGTYFEASPDEFIKEIVENPSITMNRVRRVKDSENDDVKFGWFVYIIIMFVLVIFNDRLIGWAAATIYFFTWRNKKLKE